MLDELGAVDVRDQHRRGKGLIHLLHQGDGAVRVPADDDAVRLHEVCHGAAFTQELRIADDIKLHAGLGIAADGLRHTLTGLHRHGALVHDHAVAVQELGDLTGHLFDEAQVHAAICLRRCGHGDEEHLPMVHAFLGAGGEAQALRRHILLHQRLQAGLINGDLTSQQGLDLAGVIVHADDVVPHFGKAGACGESDVTRTDDGELHEGERTKG